MNNVRYKVGAILQHFKNFIYPPCCLHCEALIENEIKLFCSNCFAIMELIPPEERCQYCFSSEIHNEKRVCNKCLEDLPLWYRGASALDYNGPAVTLITAMKYGNQPYLAKGAAAMMASQFIMLDWPLPDVIVPVPIPLVRLIQRGYNQSLHLSTHLGEFLNRPVCDVLKRKSGDYSQAGLSSNQRKELRVDSFTLLKSTDLEDKIILLIDDVMTTGSTLNCCAEILLGAFPRKIYALTVCRAI